MHPLSVPRSLLLFTVLALLALAHPAVSGAQGEEAWRVEFDDICAKTSDSQGLSNEELGKLITRCDNLKPQIEALGESQRKVYLRRLKMCRDLFSYVLESKKP